MTRYDEVVLPYTSGYLVRAPHHQRHAAGEVPLDLAGHVLIPIDGPAIRLVLDALGRRGPAEPAVPAVLPALRTTRPPADTAVRMPGGACWGTIIY